MALVAPKPVSFSPYRRILDDVRAERSVALPFPPGDTGFSARRTRGFVTNPLGILLDAYARHGPVFTQRILYQNVVFMLGPEANHHILVANAKNFSWRDGHFGDLIPLLGDGLLTIDGDFHRRSRRIMLPAFHRERIAAAIGVMQEETERALAPWEDGQRIDLYHWTRDLALRIAMRALFGLDPDRSARDLDAAEEFEVALGYYGRDYVLQALRGPGTPFHAMQRARKRLDALIFGEIERRRRTGERGEDLLSLLLDAEDEDGDRLTDQLVRDEVMTLLFAGHDTTTSTICFLLYELSRDHAARDTLLGELDAVLGGRPPTAQELMSGETLPGLEMALDETLRLWPPAWVGPRRSIEQFEFAGVTVPGNVPVEYSSWVSHRLPDVWEDPDEFRPERFTPAAKAALPKGAYVPFGGGSRTCIGMRFGQLEIRAIAARILRDHVVDLEPGFRLEVRQTPTLGPKDGMPVRISARTGSLSGV